MRVALPLIALLIATGATADAPSAPRAQGKTANFVPNELRAPQGKTVCNARIQQAREARGFPKLQRDEVSPDKPLMILAVDKRIDGCSVMVMAYNANDIRPVPAEGKLRVIK